LITAVQKPFEEISEMVKGFNNLLVLGCGSCVTVCMAGGEKEVEFFDDIKEKIDRADAVLSMACGVGVQFCSEVFEGKRILPALNTKFYGATEQQGMWSERCAGCGDCVLDKFGGVCPIARCSKSLLNGPCGGSQDGKCEVDPENIDCGWQLIYDRLKSLDLLSRLEENEPIKDWSTGRDGGPGKIVREDMVL